MGQKQRSIFTLTVYSIFTVTVYAEEEMIHHFFSAYTHMHTLSNWKHLRFPALQRLLLLIIRSKSVLQDGRGLKKERKKVRLPVSRNAGRHNESGGKDYLLH